MKELHRIICKGTLVHPNYFVTIATRNIGLEKKVVRFAERLWMLAHTAPNIPAGDLLDLLLGKYEVVVDLSAETATIVDRNADPDPEESVLDKFKAFMNENGLRVRADVNSETCTVYPYLVDSNGYEYDLVDGFEEEVYEYGSDTYRIGPSVCVRFFDGGGFDLMDKPQHPAKRIWIDRYAAKLFVKVIETLTKLNETGCEENDAVHLGSGAYAALQDGRIKLMANSHEYPTDVIWLNINSAKELSRLIQGKGGLR